MWLVINTIVQTELTHNSIHISQVKEHSAAQKAKDPKTDGAIAPNTQKETRTKSANRNSRHLEPDSGHLFWSYLGSAKRCFLGHICVLPACQFLVL